MIIPLDKCYQIPNLDSFHMTFSEQGKAVSTLRSDARTHSMGTIERTRVTQRTIDIIGDRAMREADINATADFIKFLNEKWPEDFPPPTGKKRLDELLITVDEYNQMNAKSEKKRHIRIAQDLIDRKCIEGQKAAVHYGTVISDRVEKVIRKQCDLVEKVDYIDSEKGILVFVPNPQHISLKVDLFALLAAMHMDITDASSVEEAVDIYMKKSPKMVILGDLNAELATKRVFLRLDEWDPYVKKLNYEESPASNRASESIRIEKTYYGPYAPMIEMIHRQKDPIPPEIKEKFRLMTDRLHQQYNDDQFYETMYALKQIGRMFNIIAQKKQLEMIRIQARRGMD